MKNVLKPLTIAAFLTLTVLEQATVAHAQDWRKNAKGREVECLLDVKGKTYLKGTCVYEADKDGSFRLFGDKYFLYLSTFENGTAGVSWNGISQASHAQELLGEDFKRNGACWTGKQGKVCAWDKKQDSKQHDSTDKERIQFAKGASSATVTGKLGSFDDKKNYVLEVGTGQTMTIEPLTKQSDGRVSIYVTDPNGENANDMDLSCHSNPTVKSTLAGDYKIQVVQCMKADSWKGKFAFKVTVK